MDKDRMTETVKGGPLSQGSCQEEDLAQRVWHFDRNMYYYYYTICTAHKFQQAWDGGAVHKYTQIIWPAGI